MKNRLVILSIGLAAIASVFALSSRFLETRDNMDTLREARQLIVYANSSFIDSFGPGLDLKQEFEKTCDCVVKYIDAGGISEVLEKLKSNPNRRVDVVLGLDLLSLSSAAKSVRFQSLGSLSADWVPEIKGRKYKRFIPYDWSPVGIVYKSGEVDKFKSWKDMFTSKGSDRLSLPDPEMSSLGLTWLYWFFSSAKGDEPQVSDSFQNLRKLAHSFSPSWSAAYGLFKSGQTSMVFTYLTSLLYHWREENDHSYQFMNFQEGHPVQIEYGAVPDACWNCGVAKAFVKFLTLPYAQNVLYRKNYMLPVIELNIQDSFYEKLPKPRVISPENLDKFATKKADLLRLFRQSRNSSL